MLMSTCCSPYAESNHIHYTILRWCCDHITTCLKIEFKKREGVQTFKIIFTTDFTRLTSKPYVHQVECD